MLRGAPRVLQAVKCISDLVQMRMLTTSHALIFGTLQGTLIGFPGSQNA
jgi:hypothetical protein